MPVHLGNMKIVITDKQMVVMFGPNFSAGMPVIISSRNASLLENVLPCILCVYPKNVQCGENDGLVSYFYR